LLRTCSVTVLAGRSAIPSPGAVDRRFSSSLPGEHVDGLDRLLRRCPAHKEPVVTRVERVCPAGGVLPHGCIPGAKVSSPVRDRHRRFEPCRDGKSLSSRVLVGRAVSLASTTSERRSRSSAQTAVIYRSDRSSAQARTVPSRSLCSNRSDSPTHERATEPEHCGSRIHASWPWVARSVPWSHGPRRLRLYQHEPQEPQEHRLWSLGADYSTAPVTYDLRRSRLTGSSSKSHTNT